MIAARNLSIHDLGSRGDDFEPGVPARKLERIGRCVRYLVRKEMVEQKSDSHWTTPGVAAMVVCE